MVEDVAGRLAEALYAGAPVPSGCRVNHARGLLVEGRFRPTSEARALCRAGTFAGADVSVVARFSSSTGNPNVAEDHAMANPRGLAIAIGCDLVLVGHSVQAFPARTPEEFVEFIEALNDHGETPERLDRYMRDHRAARLFEAARPAVPTSFATLRYHFLHAYCLTDRNGRSTNGRLSIAGVAVAEEAPGRLPQGAAYLSEEIRDRLSSGPVELQLDFAPAGEGDALDDITAPWPDRGDFIALGRLVLERVTSDQQAQRRIVFHPSHLPEGITFSGDPMLEARLRAYSLVGRRRTGGAPDYYPQMIEARSPGPASA